MSDRNPLSSQCTAMSKRSGQRCQHRVIGGGVCHMHGGRAPQVAARREARIAEGEARRRGEPIVERDPAEALIAAAVSADELAQRLRRQLDDRETLDAATLYALGEWLDRVGRLAKAVVDTRVEFRKLELDQAKLEMMAAALVHGLLVAAVPPVRRDVVLAEMFAELHRLAGGGVGHVEPVRIGPAGVRELGAGSL